MVKFGRHINAFETHDNAGTGLFVVPYNTIKGLIRHEHKEGLKLADNNGNGEVTQDRKHPFEDEWRKALKKAADDFNQAVSDVWENIFHRISNTEEARGALPDVAIRLFVQHTGAESANELLAKLKHIHAAAYNNAEALRKLAKKFDKHNATISSSSQEKQQHVENKISSALIPKIYSASFTMGLPMLEQGIELTRCLLGLNDDDNIEEDDKQPSNRDYNSEVDLHRKLVEGRHAELEWLRQVVNSIAIDELSRLVAHRGFHSVPDRAGKRPIENSLTAYEAAWTNGIHLCECDVALTKDEKLILAHDSDFSRLALDPNSPESSKRIGDLTLKELISLPLLSGSRPPLLLDVLRSARAIGGHAQLVIEIKPGNEEAASALARMLLNHAEFMPYVSMIMSFDAFVIHNLRAELFNSQQAIKHRGEGNNNMVSVPTKLGLGSKMSLLRFGASSTDLNGLAGKQTQVGSMDHFGIGLTLSDAHLDDHMENTREESAVSSPQSSYHTSIFPKLMLLTVADKPKETCPLSTATPPEDCHLWVTIDDLSPVDAWLKSGEGYLDGVYLQFQKEMLEPDGANALLELSQRYCIGVWGYAGKDPDDFKTFQRLVRSGVTFVNTDLPSTFQPDILVKS